MFKFVIRMCGLCADALIYMPKRYAINDLQCACNEKITILFLAGIYEDYNSEALLG